VSGPTVYAYADGNPVSNIDPLGLFITSVDAACAIDPNFCAEIFGQIAQNAAALSQNSCEQEAADAVSGALHTAANVASFFAIAKNLSRFEQKLPSGRRPTAIRNLPNGGKAFQSEVPGRVPGSSAVYEKQVDANGVTIQYTKTTYDPAGTIVSVKDKIGGGTYP
jgi:hypothetical protein